MTIDQIIESFHRHPVYEKFKEMIAEKLFHITIEASVGTADEYGWNIDMDTVQEMAKEHAKQHALDLLSGKYNIMESTKKQLKNIVASSFENGDTANALQEKLLDAYPFSIPRALCIARTEFQRSQQIGSLIAAKASGDMAGKGINREPYDEVDICDEAKERGVIPLEEDFVAGYPGPPFHPNCRCTLYYDDLPE